MLLEGSRTAAQSLGLLLSACAGVGSGGDGAAAELSAGGAGAVTGAGTGVADLSTGFAGVAGIVGAGAGAANSLLCSLPLMAPLPPLQPIPARSMYATTSRVPQRHASDGGWTQFGQSGRANAYQAVGRGSAATP